MNTTLVIMAAGMGSRFGEGVKQLEPLGPKGETIMEYSIHDALKAGFNKVVFITRRELVERFDASVKKAVGDAVETQYVFQEIADVPEGYSVDPERKKPWGTGQAILACKDVVKEPFLVINADDYYGKEAFKTIHDHLVNANSTPEKYDFCMAGFILGNTLSDNGSVTRGVCVVDDKGNLVGVNETEDIVKTGTGAGIEGEAGVTPIDANSHVSMNMWGFTPEIFDVLDKGFKEFLDDPSTNQVKGEYLIPTVVDELIKAGKATVKVLETKDKWFGLTYQADVETVKAALKGLADAGIYPETLF